MGCLKVKEPIIVVGTGRSGTTIFYKLLSRHPNVAYPVWLVEHKQDERTIKLNRLFLRMMDFPPLENYFMKKYGPKECIYFCAKSCPCFIEVCRDMHGGDVTNKIKESMHKQMSLLLTSKRYRLAIKRTGWPFMRFLLEIFPDAKFIHVIRDGRAVANSYINVDWWKGWLGPHQWRFGELSKEYMEEWIKYDKSFVALAAIEWKHLMDHFEEAKKEIPKSQYLEIRYEDLVKDHISIFKKVTSFAGLEWNRKFEKKLKTYNLKNMNYKWKHELTKKQQEILNEILEEHLRKYGYL